ncbi:MAG: tetratricopeptide repeat protein [Planctomycetota bacterium]
MLRLPGGHRLNRVLWAAGVSCALLSPLSGQAGLNAVEEQAIASTYGSGVHSYFAGDYARSHEILSQAIEAGTGDPRAWYFRGLAALKLGRLDEAEADFSAGARRESENAGAWGVAKSLERVQGCERLQLERHRVRARVASLQEDRRRSRLRYLEVESAEPEVLRDRVPEMVRPAVPDQPFKPVTPGAAPETIPEELAPPLDPPADENPAFPAAEAADAAPPDASDPFGAVEPSTDSNTAPVIP